MEQRRISEEEEREVAAIRDDLLSFMSKHGPGIEEDFDTWYVGITEDVVRRFIEHSVRESDPSTAKHASSVEVAREVERIFTEVYGAKGETGGSKDGDWVYGYKRASHTKP